MNNWRASSKRQYWGVFRTTHPYLTNLMEVEVAPWSGYNAEIFFVVVDSLNPRGWLGWDWNRFYVCFAGDAGSFGYIRRGGRSHIGSERWRPVYFYRNTPMLASGIKGMRIQLRDRSGRFSAIFMRRHLACPAACCAGEPSQFHFSITL